MCDLYHRSAGGGDYSPVYQSIQWMGLLTASSFDLTQKLVGNPQIASDLPVFEF